MLASEVNSADYSDSRLDAMSDVLDSVDIKDGVKTLFRTMITPFAQEKDWAMIAEWNANSIIGCFERHLEQCNNSLDKTMKLMENAIREDVGNEISKLNVDKLIFRRDAQQLNINRFCRDWFLFFDIIPSHYDLAVFLAALDSSPK